MNVHGSKRRATESMMRVCSVCLCTRVACMFYASALGVLAHGCENSKGIVCVCALFESLDMRYVMHVHNASLAVTCACDRVQICAGKEM